MSQKIEVPKLSKEALELLSELICNEIDIRSIKDIPLSEELIELACWLSEFNEQRDKK
ncbi:MAG TPA: hypothetical protein V6C58_18775 [Allocoleopsis sp.]